MGASGLTWQCVLRDAAADSPDVILPQLGVSRSIAWLGVWSLNCAYGGHSCPSEEILSLAARLASLLLSALVAGLLSQKGSTLPYPGIFLSMCSAVTCLLLVESFTRAYMQLVPFNLYAGPG